MSESRMRVPDKVKEVAKEDFDQAKQLASDAIRSAAYLYPFKVSYTFAMSKKQQTQHGEVVRTDVLRTTVSYCDLRTDLQATVSSLPQPYQNFTNVWKA